MSEDISQKKQVPRGFLKKRIEEKEKKNDQYLAESQETIQNAEDISEEQKTEEKTVDFQALVRDLMLNKYFQIMEKEARPIAERMVREGSQALHEVRWFLSSQERVDLAKFLAQKHGLD